jgi:glycosyltransferase involved in cell wall biosynthesis
LNKLKLANFPHNIYSKYACYKLALRLSGATNPAIFGFTVFAGIPMKYWTCFDTDIKEPWERPNYYNGYPNLFKILETNNVRYEVVGTNSKDLPDSSRVVRKHNPREKVPLLNYFIGDIDHLSHEYGQDACETIRRLREIDEILQEKYIKRELPNVKFYVVGREPDNRIKKLSFDPSVIVTGSVNDVRPYFAASEVFVNPIIIDDGGIKNKVLEAMAMGKAVVSTPLGARDIGATDYENIVIARNDREFAEKVVELLKDEKERRRIGNNARKFVEENYSWEKQSKMLYNVFKELVEGNFDEFH